MITRFQPGDRIETNLFGSKHVRQGTVTKVTRTGVWVRLDNWDHSVRFAKDADRLRPASPSVEG